MKPCAVKRFAVIGLAIWLVVGCAQTRVVKLEPASPDLFDPAAPLVTAGSCSVVDRHGHVAAGAGEGIGLGMAVGAGGAIGGGAMSGNPLGFALGLVIAPIAAVGGGVVGAATAHPAEETEAALAAIEQVYADQALLGGLAETIEGRVLDLGYEALPPCGEPEAAESASADDCDFLASNRLIITVTYGFSTDGNFSPDLEFGIDVDALAANADPSREAAAFRWVYLSPQLDFFDATRDGAALLRREIVDAQERLADQVMDDLLLARREATVSGTSPARGKREIFRPDAVTPGAPVRVPIDAELAHLPGQSVGE